MSDKNAKTAADAQTSRFAVIRRARPHESGQDSTIGTFSSRERAQRCIASHDDNGRGFYKAAEFRIVEIPPPGVEASPLVPDISPLTEADPAAINDLIASRLDAAMNKAPKLVTPSDLAAMVQYYRESRAKHLADSQAKAAAKTGPKAPRASKPKTPKSVAEVTKNYSDLL